MLASARLFPVLLVFVPSPGAQAGDREGEQQPYLPADLEIPDAPVLSPEEELATFEIEPGFRIELVAAEPLVEDPVAATFDGDGRLWVCEMRGFMPNVDGEGEDAPVGAVVVLTDTDEDGRMDQRTVFMDELVLPRAVAPCYDGALVIAPPDLIFARDTDGDGVADEREVIDTGLGGIDSPEHAINGLLYTLDNWYRCANAPVSYRRVDGKWEERRTAGGGQWGITKDDWGRIFYNTNSDPLRGDLYASHYAVRNPNHGTAFGVNVRLAEDMRVWPARITPGVNRGYREGTLRNDYTLATFTAACGPHIYRGDALPPVLRGSAFVCEPAGNLIKRYIVAKERGIRLNARPGRTRKKDRDFLTSTDERFRPVNLFGGPDGTLYVVDMYRGIIQHRMFVTSFLRKQIEERGLDRPLGLGRIWRIVDADARSSTEPKASHSSWTELIQMLSHPNGWWRDTAQRIIVEEGADEPESYVLLENAALNGTDPMGRMHALWALQGMGRLSAALVRKALDDPSGRVRLTAVVLAEPFLASGAEGLLFRILQLGNGSDLRMRHQVLLTLGEAGTEQADTAMAELLAADAALPEMRAAVLSGLAERELAFLGQLLTSQRWKEPAPGLGTVLELCARNIVREGRGDRIRALLVLITHCDLDWQRRVLLRGALTGRPKTPRGEPGPIRLNREPVSFAALEELEGTDEVVAALTWPGGPSFEEEEVRPLTTEEQARFDAGRELYAKTCASCHQSSGMGEGGKAPALRFAPWVLGSEERLVRILLQGMEGPVTRNGERWDMEMPGLVAPDEDIAAILTYVRREWGHGADPVTAETVARIRAETKTRTEPWSPLDLEALD